MTRPRGAIRLSFLLLLAASLSVGGAVLMAWLAGFGKIFAAVRHVHPGWFAMCAGTQVLALFAYAFAYREAARVGGGNEISHRPAALLATAGFGAFLPRGGFSFDFGTFRESGDGERRARTRVVALSMLEYAILAPAALVSAVVLLAGNSNAQSQLTVSWCIGVPLGAAVALTAFARRNRLRARGGWRKRVADFAAPIELVLTLARRPGRHAAGFLGMALYWASDIACLWAALRAFGVDLSAFAAILALATGYAMTRRTLPLAGAGITEVLMSFALSWVGVPLPVAVVGVFAYRVFNVWIPTGPALASLPAVDRIPVPKRPTRAAA